MSDEPDLKPRRKLSEQSKKLLKREVRHVEGQLEAEFQRPFKMRREAEAVLACFPPWPAILAVIFGGLLALVAIPSAFSYHSFTWERQHRQLAAMQSPEQIEAFPSGNNWRAVTLILPFAVLVGGLAFWGRRHKLAYLGLGLYGFAVLETILVAAICEWSDAKERQLLIMELRVRLAESPPARAPRTRKEENPPDDEHKLALEELRYRLEEEQQQRRLADLEAVQKSIRARLQAEREAAEKAEQERSVAEAERKKLDEQQRAATEQERREEERRMEQALKEMRTAELERAREERKEQLQAAQERLDRLAASRQPLAASRDEIARNVEALEARAKTLAGQQAQLAEQIKAQEELLRGAEQVLERATDQRAELTKKLKTAGSLKTSEEKALRQAENMAKASAQLKSTTLKDLRDLKTQSNTLQSDIRKLETEQLKLKNELARAEASLKDLDERIGQAQTAVNDLKD